MWTTFKDYRSRLKGKGYSNQFISYNCRSTNEYDKRYNLAYCVNVYLHPTISIVIAILYLFYRFGYAILRYCGLVHHLLPLDGSYEAPTTVSLLIC